MVTNSISPFEGTLVWVGTPNSGTSQNTGQQWKVVDFTIKYTDGQMQEQYMVLTASGVERVDKLLTIPLGTTLRVDFKITARKNEYNGQEKWWGTLAVWKITPVMPQAQPVQPTQPQAPAQGYSPMDYMQQPTQMPAQSPLFQQPVQQRPPLVVTPPEDSDLPFSQSPGV